MMHTNECAVGIPTRQDKSKLIVPQRNSFVNTGTLQGQRLRLMLLEFRVSNLEEWLESGIIQLSRRGLGEAYDETDHDVGYPARA